MIILISALFALFLAFILGTALGFFREFFAVPEDPLTGRIRALLPGANCGACGFPGCDNYASAVSAGNARANACTVGGPSVVGQIAAITGVTSGEIIESVAVLACQGSSMHAPLKGIYTGIQTCRGAKIAGGTKLCSWGCLGFGDCVKACQFGAISMSEANLPKINYAKCGGCMLCSAECPQGLLKKIERNQKGVMALCSNHNPIRQMVAKTCKIACIKCGLCVKNCPKQCITLVDGLPSADLSKCDSCGTCAEKCPTKVLKIIERNIIP
ncbi:MAG: RnfABCDGE type electron transport complex subunit B [Treponema sp.]|jgi:RnfABCDGE-type electron transport complex B subunit|nr:RnfABCDGE type electron transport complex subunit B [Treponema sp.]